jgi:hypothetical protein
MANEKTNYEQPAFPPQFAQDSLGRILAPIPGLTKLEFAAIMLLPHYLNLGKTRALTANGNKVTATEAAIIKAKELLDKINQVDETNIGTISTLIEKP